MTQLERFRETIERYRKFEWTPRRLLVTSVSRVQILTDNSIGDAPLLDSEIDAVWFSRVSSGGRDAWELRLIADAPFALLETFEADETEEEREDVRIEMEARMRAHVLEPQTSREADQ